MNDKEHIDELSFFSFLYNKTLFCQISGQLYNLELQATVLKCIQMSENHIENHCTCILHIVLF